MAKPARLAQVGLPLHGIAFSLTIDCIPSKARNLGYIVFTVTKAIISPTMEHENIQFTQWVYQNFSPTSIDHVCRATWIVLPLYIADTCVQNIVIYEMSI